MEQNSEEQKELAPFHAIRVETVLSRFPVHRLATRGDVTIDLQEKNDSGITVFSWKVDYNASYGQPGPLAYKLDTLIINRRIEEARPRVPKLLRLGSLSDLCKELGLADSGKNRTDIRKSLMQNAFAGIVPLVNYRSNDGTENTLDTAFTRYSIIFTGKKLPNGTKANAVFILLNDIFLQVISGVSTRPLDYEYLKRLPPVSQRFYEILSYRMYGTLRNERPRAKLIYSELCAYAPQKRHLNKKQAMQQMRQVHRQHLESGYIAEVNYQEILDDTGNIDWVMLYKPGAKARADFRAFEKRGGPNILEIEPFDPFGMKLTSAVIDPLPPTSPLAQALSDRGLSDVSIKEILANVHSSVVEEQIDVFDWLLSQKDKKVAKSPSGYLAKSILEDWKKPAGYVPKQEREKQAEATRSEAEQVAAQHTRGKKHDIARKQALLAVDEHLKHLSVAERDELEAKVLAAADLQTRENYQSPHMVRFRPTMMLTMIREYLQPALKQSEQPAEAQAS